MKQRLKSEPVELTLTVVPAYGRDYKSQDAAVKDWQGGKDFLIMDVSSPYDGKYVSIRDVPGHAVKIRYGTVKNTGWVLPDFVFVRGTEVVGGSEDDLKEDS